jgi:hypothetical protein
MIVSPALFVFSIEIVAANPLAAARVGEYRCPTQHIDRFATPVQTRYISATS